jgi:hypothetical protein
MAVSAVYCIISRIPGNGPWEQSHIESNISTTSGTFILQGGKYAMDTIGTSFGSVTLQRLGPDGSTYVTAATAVVANGAATVDLPPGIYKLALA